MPSTLTRTWRQHLALMVQSRARKVICNKHPGPWTQGHGHWPPSLLRLKRASCSCARSRFSAPDGLNDTPGMDLCNPSPTPVSLTRAGAILSPPDSQYAKSPRNRQPVRTTRKVIRPSPIATPIPRVTASFSNSPPQDGISQGTAFTSISQVQLQVTGDSNWLWRSKRVRNQVRATTRYCCI